MVKSDDIAVVVSGEAGQGLQTLQALIARMAKRTGYHIFASGEVMSRIKGGNNTSLLRVASSRVRAAVGRIDIFVPLGKNAVCRVAGRIDENTFIFADESHLGAEYDSLTAAVHIVPFTRMSEMCGGGLCLNIVAAGFIAALLNIPGYTVLDEVKRGLSRLDEDGVKRNTDAAQKGFEAGREIVDAGVLSVRLASSERVKEDHLMEGTDSIGIGSLAGGCNFVSSYPMSPSTNLLVFMAARAAEFELVVEQAEDEIAAVNMACGAWHAGARALVTTSGGGFALMTEGVSLAGGAELPLVVHVAQRPGLPRAFPRAPNRET
jgi:2-oxoglutarate ferredoxin oxidoreductase subunit alpha